MTRLIICVTSLLFSLNAFASNWCDMGKVTSTIGFVNGIHNDEYDAIGSMKELKKRHTSSIENDGVEHPIKYGYLYNSSVLLMDVFETFSQRMDEDDAEPIRDRWELFWESLEKRPEDSWWDAIITSLSHLVDVFSYLTDKFTETAIGLLGKLMTSDMAEQDYKRHEGKIDEWAKRGNIVLVPHSQGNLFANKAYNYANTFMDSELITVVHVAPASKELNGRHFLAKQDTVINGLLWTVGETHSPTHDISWEGLSNHGFLPIYMNKEIYATRVDEQDEQGEQQGLLANDIEEHINDSLRAMIHSALEEGIKARSLLEVRLTWYYQGDMALVVTEPDGTMIHQNDQQGTVGRLTENSAYFGPEIYQIACESNGAQSPEGLYRISAYNATRGPLAHLAIFDRNNIVYFEPKVPLAPGAQDHLLQYINIEKDDESGRYQVSVID